jgi:hypothetical protein
MCVCVCVCVCVCSADPSPRPARSSCVCVCVDKLHQNIIRLEQVVCVCVCVRACVLVIALVCGWTSGTYSTNTFDQWAHIKYKNIAMHSLEVPY